MDVLRLDIRTDAEHAQALAELLRRFGVDSVSFTPVGAAYPVCVAAAEAEVPCLWSQTRVSALLSPDSELDVLLGCIRRHIGDAHIHGHALAVVRQADWQYGAHGLLRPLPLDAALCVCPVWCAPPPGVDVIWLDPGLAFGTGSHPTTALCLRWLLQWRQSLRGCTLIDYGCGSGILALVAARLGARMVYAVDTDPQAIVACRANARRNGLSRIEVLKVEEDRPVELPAADVLLANLLLRPLRALAQTFDGLLRPGGRLVLSGLLATQVEECAGAYRTWLRMEPAVFSREWARLEGSRR